jgi:outer membrane lipoprotein carrier protein
LATADVKWKMGDGSPRFGNLIRNGAVSRSKKMKTECSKPLLAMALLVSVTALLGSAESAYADEAEPTASQIVDKVQDFYAGVDDYKAAFVQTTAHKMFSGRLERGYGTLMFKKGGLMRWEYNRPDVKYFIYDGTFLWIYEPAVPQAFKGAADTERLRRALAFLTGEGKIKDVYKVKKARAERYGFAEGFVLKLKPKKKNSPFKHVELYVSKKDYHVVRSVVVDHDGNRNRLDFSNVKTNNGLAAGLFEFTPPKGVPVIEGPAQ